MRRPLVEYARSGPLDAWRRADEPQRLPMRWCDQVSTGAHHRHRAGQLRALARHLEAQPVWTLPDRAGPDTWRGSRPSVCLHQLRVDLAHLDAAMADLRRSAALHERRADELDAEARSRAAGGGAT